MTSNKPRRPSFFFSRNFAIRELRQLERGIDEQLAGIVAGLAVDIDGAGVVGRERVVVPEVIGEPRVRLGDGDEIPARVRWPMPRTPGFRGRADLVDARRVFQQRADFVADRGIVHINMGDLVIGHGEGAAAAAIECLAAEFVLEREPAFRAEQAVEVDRPADTARCRIRRAPARARPRLS